MANELTPQEKVRLSLKPKNCKICGDLFQPGSGAAKYCSNKCFQEGQRLGNIAIKNRLAKEYECKYCKKPFTRYQSRAGFCDQRCSALFYSESGEMAKWKVYVGRKKTGEYGNCLICGEQFYEPRYTVGTRRTCGSEQCKNEFRKNHWPKHKPGQDEKFKATMLEKYGVECPFQLHKPGGTSKISKRLLHEIKKIFSFEIIVEEIFWVNDETSFIPDFLIESKKIIIEFNGTYWHCDPREYESTYFNEKKNKTAQEIWDYDQRRKEIFEKLGYKVLVVWEEDFIKDPQSVIKTLIEALSD